MTIEEWREKWLRAINELSSKELQKNCKIILTKNGSNWTMVDFVNCHFGEFLFGLDYLYYKDGNNWLYPIDYEFLKDWQNDIESCLMPDSEDFSNISILNYSKWLSIRCKEILAQKNL